jgi:hypothetical protein
MDMIQMNFLARSHGLRRVAALWPCIFLTLLGRVEATTITAASPSLIDVISAVSSAVDGDTVVIPGGTATWRSGLAITKAITLQGSGIGNTIIQDGITTSDTPLIQFTLVSGKPSRLTAIEFQNNGMVSTFSGALRFQIPPGMNPLNGQTIRVDNCKLTGIKGAITFQGCIGVADHNQISSDIGGAFFIAGRYWGGTTPFGDASWAAPINFGGPNFLFIEDNTFVGTAVSLSRSLTDADSGARFVVRHNDIQDGIISNHGLDSTGRYRSCLAMDVYNNTFHQTTTAKGNFIGGTRGGVVLFHDNTVVGFTTQPVFDLSLYRMFAGFNSLWWPGGATGTNPWDKNAPGGPFYSGKASVASSATTLPNGGAAVLVTVSGSPGWTTNQWVGYSVTRTSNLAGANTETCSVILASTANSLTYSTAGGFSPNLSFAAGDSLQLWKVTQAMDMPGVSGGSIVVNATSSITPVESPPTGWNDQVITPCYSWNNTILDNNTHLNFHQGSVMVVQGTHYFQDTPMPGYTPYTYPHPLVSGVPAPPTNLKVVSGQ